MPDFGGQPAEGGESERGDSAGNVGVTPDSSGSEAAEADAASNPTDAETAVQSQGAGEDAVAEKTSAAASKGSLSIFSSTDAEVIDENANCSEPEKVVSDKKTGAIELYDSHPYEVAFSASEGGSIVAGDPASIPSGSGFTNIVEIGEDSLSGMSYKITALCDFGYHFVHWYDALTGEIISTESSLVLHRPESGWHDEWSIEAVFAPNAYVILLDQNGGKSIAEGTQADEAVYFEVWSGKSFKLPKNGSDELWFARAGYEFAGWNAVAEPRVGEKRMSAAISDGQTINSALEKLLIDRGFLVLDWSDGNLPVLTLYAQWAPKQATITYQAGNGGVIVLDSDGADQSASTVSEKLDASTGVNSGDAEKTGPTGAYASNDARHHFTGWEVGGSAHEMTKAEASSELLSSTVVTRLSYYSDVNVLGEQYHTIVFTASFSPNTYVFTYGANGGTGSIESESLTYGKTLSVASEGVEREGYKLTGWNLASDGSGASMALGSTIDSKMVDSLIKAGYLADENNAMTTLYAQWEKDEVVEPVNEGGDTPAIPSAEEVGPKEAESVSADTGIQTVVENSGSTQQPQTIDDDAADEPGSQESTEEEPSGKPASEQTGDQGGTGNRVPGGSSPAGSGNPVLDFVANMVATEPTAPESNPSAKADAGKPQGLLATPGKGKRLGVEGPLAAMGSYVESAAESGNPLAQLMTPEGMKTAGTTVAAVAAVGAIAGLVGIGVSAAGAATIAAGTVGAASAVGLTTAADLAADLAASAAAGAAAAGAAAKRRRRDEDGADSE